MNYREASVSARIGSMLLPASVWPAVNCSPLASGNEGSVAALPCQIPKLMDTSAKAPAASAVVIVDGHASELVQHLSSLPGLLTELSLALTGDFAAPDACPACICCFYLH